MKKAFATLAAVLLVVVVAQWFVLWRIGRENRQFRDAAIRAALEPATEGARKRDTEAGSYRGDLGALRAEVQRLRQELEQAKKVGSATLPGGQTATLLRPDTPISAPAPTPSRVVLTAKDVDLGSLRVIRLADGAGNLHVELPGRSSEEIGAMAGIQKCEIIVDGQTAAGAVRFVRDGTNAGLVLAFANAEQAMAAANALRTPSRDDQ